MAIHVTHYEAVAELWCLIMPTNLFLLTERLIVEEKPSLSTRSLLSILAYL